MGLTSTAIGATVAGLTESPTFGELVGALIGGLAIDLSNSCPEEPPADVTITLQDIYDAQRFDDSAVNFPALDKLRQWFLHRYWYIACECVNTTTPAPPTGGAPTGVGINTGLPSGQVTPCWQTDVGSSGVSLLDDGVNPDVFIDYNAIFPGTQTVQVDAYDTRLTHSSAKVLPQPLPHAWHAHWAGTYTGNNGLFLRIVFYDAGGHPIVGSGWSQVSAGTSFSLTAPAQNVPTNAVSALSVLDIGATGTDVGLPYTNTLNFSWDCDTANTPTTPCCPPDPILDQKLNQIYGLLQEILTNLNVGPDTYTAGPVHSGLSGDASFTLSKGTTAVQISVTSSLSGFGEGSDHPPYFYSLGFFTPVSIGTPLRGSRLIYGQQIYPLQPQADQVYLALAPGLVVTATELLNGTR